MSWGWRREWSWGPLRQAGLDGPKSWKEGMSFEVSPTLCSCFPLVFDVQGLVRRRGPGNTFGPKQDYKLEESHLQVDPPTRRPEPSFKRSQPHTEFRSSLLCLLARKQKEGSPSRTGLFTFKLVKVKFKTQFFNHTKHTSSASHPHLARGCHIEQHRERMFPSSRKIPLCSVV